MYGTHQHPSFDQGWVGWFCRKALEIKNEMLKQPFTISGTGKQVRDLLHASDVVKLYFLAKDCPDTYGQAFNIGGGIENSLSLLELFEILEKLLDVKMNYQLTPWRESDQKVFVADINKIQSLIHWKPTKNKLDGIKSILMENEN
jgi:CDP-paratose 2-epimerase